MRRVLYSIGLILVAVVSIHGAVRFIGGAGLEPYDYRQDVMITEYTDTASRFIDLDGSFNTRDIGGYPAREGMIARNTVYRSDHLHLLTDEDLKKITSLGIRTVIDLREPGRAETYPNRLPEEVISYELPIYDGTKPLHVPVLIRRNSISSYFQKSYVEYLDEWGHRFLPIFELISDPSAYPVLYHCSNGKDRAGVLTALLLDLAGVRRELIVSDFSLSNYHIEQVIEKFIDHEEGTLLMRLGVPREELSELMGVRTQWIQNLLDHIDMTYGSTRGYLEHIGISQGILTAVIGNITDAE